MYKGIYAKRLAKRPKCIKYRQQNSPKKFQSYEAFIVCCFRGQTNLLSNTCFGIQAKDETVLLKINYFFQNIYMRHFLYLAEEGDV